MKPADLANPSRPAANALKHGFCATRFVAKETCALAESIRADLIRIHEPRDDDEYDAIEELALEMARLHRIEYAMASTHAEDEKQARKNYENQCRRQFLEDFEAWNRAPSVYLESIGETYEGAAWLARIWSRIVECLVPGGPGLSFDLAQKAVLMKGSSWKVSVMTTEGAWIMTRFVRTSIEPDGELRNWVERSGGITDLTRAQWHLDRAPDRETCRREFAAEANRQFAHWSLRAKDLRSNYETAAETAADRFTGVLPGDKAQNDAFRLNLRYLTSTRNRVDRLRRRLDLLKKARDIAEIRAARKAARDARRQPETEPPQPAPQVPDLQDLPAPDPCEPVETGPNPARSISLSPISEVERAEETTVGRHGTNAIPATPEPLRPHPETISKPAQADAPNSPKLFETLRAEFLDDRIPLGTRADALAKRLGIRLDDPLFDHDEDDEDPLPPMSPEEQRRFDAWRREVERSTDDENAAGSA